MLSLKISINETCRQKIVVAITREKNEELKTNIELRRMNLDKWLHE